MSFSIIWSDVPERVRTNVVRYTILDRPYTSDHYLLPFREELAKFNAIYVQENTAIFESEAHYNWFILRWC